MYSSSIPEAIYSTYAHITSTIACFQERYKYDSPTWAKLALKLAKKKMSILLIQPILISFS